MSTWYGMLTTGNAGEVGRRMLTLLDGKYYTTIMTYPVVYDNDPKSLDARNDVRTSQKLYDKKMLRDGRSSIEAEVKDGRAHISIHDSFGLYMLDSNIEGDNRTNTGDYKNPYIVIDHKSVVIKHRAPAGNLLIWTFAVEDHSE